MGKREITLVSAQPYPYITKDGDLKIGSAIAYEEGSEEDALFGDAEKTVGMILLSKDESVTIVVEEEADDFSKGSLNAKMKSVSPEALAKLSDARKAITLSKAYKDQTDDMTILGEFSSDDTKKLMSSMAQTEAYTKDILVKTKESGSTNLYGFLDDYAFKKHILVVGDAGTGKTHIISQFCSDKKYTMIEEIGHSGLEAVDLIGYMIKLPDGSFGFKDGSFSEAFRKAAAGEKVVYFIDEMLRIPARELNILVGALTPDHAGNLRLRTNRPSNKDSEGIYKSEELVIPQENFWVVASSNQGSGYQTAKLDEALRDRFRLFYQEMADSEIYDIITDKLTRIGGTELFAKGMIQLVEKTRQIQETGNLTRHFSIRHLSEAVDTSENLNQVKGRMYQLVNNIVSIDASGRFNQEQTKIVREIIRTTI